MSGSEGYSQKIRFIQGENGSGCRLQSLASLKYWWVGAEIQDAEMKRMKCRGVRC